MARNRMIKPELWGSKRINMISLQSNLLFIAILNFCDDFGLIPDSNRMILGNCFPFRDNVSEKDIEKWKKELIDVGLIFAFEYNGKSLLHVTNWEKHQTVPNRGKRNYLDNDKSIQEVIDLIHEQKLNSNENQIRNDLEPKQLKIEREKIEREKEKEKDRKKKEFGKNKTVMLSDDEYQKLIEQFNPLGAEERIQKLEDYMLSKGKLREYKSHYHTILNWERMDFARNGNGNRNPITADKNYKKTKTF